MPVFVSAQTETEVSAKPGTFFYLVDTTFEKVGLFFTFNPEKKVRIATKNAASDMTIISILLFTDL